MEPSMRGSASHLTIFTETPKFDSASIRWYIHDTHFICGNRAVGACCCELTIYLSPADEPITASKLKTSNAAIAPAPSRARAQRVDFYLVRTLRASESITDGLLTADGPRGRPTRRSVSDSPGRISSPRRPHGPL
ncbi:hypothetical protein EVAR_52176_1 [Eumeta japonica]|uniref:Uncharacterized protein n=1 Tax=Eumeta variegata TaxID=151549 RepID=A0A4C1Y9U1_EUMVA|nr:hypothetical protein EVAR_52176_1 [Eumeta japonica]